MKTGWKAIVILFTLLVFTGGGIHASLQPVSGTSIHPMPPAPELLEKIGEKRVAEPFWFTNPQALQNAGIDAPSQKLELGKLRAGFSTKAGTITRTFRKLVLLVDFPDKPAKVNPPFFDSLIFTNLTSSVRMFYLENSYGQLDLITVNLPSSLGWKRAPQTLAYYTNNVYGMGSYPQNTQKLVEDLVDIVDPFINFADYDNDGDGRVEGITVVHAGRGAELSGSVNDIWSHKWGITPRKRDGVNISDYDTEPEYWINPNDMTIGVYAHEFGHNFGLPDLYDVDHSSRGVGRWSVMAGGSWNGRLGSSPAHFDAWSKKFLGFTPANNLTTSGTVQLLNAETSGDAIYRIPLNNTPSREYFMIENRQKIGYDAALPGSGLLIWHVDEAQGSNTREWYPGYNASGHYKVALEQADGLWELERNINQGNAGDPYPGSTNNRFFNAVSTPSSHNYAGQKTGVNISNISNSGYAMALTLQLESQFFGEGYICGDLNNDGVINIFDVVLLVDYVFREGKAPIVLESADVDGNGVIDVLDVEQLIAYTFQNAPEPTGCGKLPVSGKAVPSQRERQELQRQFDEAGIGIRVPGIVLTPTPAPPVTRSVSALKLELYSMSYLVSQLSVQMPSTDLQDVQRLVEEAKQLEEQGKDEESAQTLVVAKDRLESVLSMAKTRIAGLYQQYAAVFFVLALAVVAWAFWTAKSNN